MCEEGGAQRYVLLGQVGHQNQKSKISHVRLAELNRTIGTRLVIQTCFEKKAKEKIVSVFARMMPRFSAGKSSGTYITLLYTRERLLSCFRR